MHRVQSRARSIRLAAVAASLALSTTVFPALAAVAPVAVAVALHQLPHADPQKVDGTLQKYVDVIRARVRGTQPQALWAHMHEYLFEELKFSGNTLDYYNTSNSYLPAVLETKLGLPITLSLVYKSVAERLGFRCWGVGLPGHFLCGVEVDGARMLIDPFGVPWMVSCE